ncbi:MAG TPA: rubrerythrin [Oscillospiraceae bacterium]|nr:rubrerythrin [Oscillospiraceae bacterium]HNW04503.1 rubrerythrin [Oscillospiraceae bacterium]HPW00405.1 rubrerythrin [Oscillospiraceae bacterium]
MTTRDRLLRAWQNSMELVRDFQCYSKEITDDKEAADVFAAYAEEEGLHASKFREILEGYEGK